MNEIDAKYVTNIGEFDKSRRDKVRNLKDRLFGLFMSVGGVSVIGAILLIFFYLLYVVFPLIYGASIEKVFSIDGPRSESSLLLDIDEYDEIGLNIYPDGVAIFSSLLDEKIIKRSSLFPFEGRPKPLPLLPQEIQQVESMPLERQVGEEIFFRQNTS